MEEELSTGHAGLRREWLIGQALNDLRLPSGELPGELLSTLSSRGIASHWMLRQNIPSRIENSFSSSLADGNVQH